MEYVSPTKPMRHQTEYIERLRSRPREPTAADVMAVLAETGTGKTKMILDEFQMRVSKNIIDDLFVVAPAGSYRNWFEDKSDAQPSELRAHLDPRLLSRMAVAAWTGGAESRRGRERALEHEGPRALFMNVEALSSAKGKGFLFARDFMRGRRVMMVVDESTTIRGRKAKRTANIMRLRSLARVRRIMSGLVTPKSPMDLYKQFEFLDPRILGCDSFVAFRARYAVTQVACFLPYGVIEAKLMKFLEGRHQSPERRVAIRDSLDRDSMVRYILDNGGWIQSTVVIKEFRHLEELRAKIAPYSFQVLKSECLDLRPKTYMTRDVELTDEQRRMYREILEYATTEIETSGTHLVVSSVITAIMRLHQVVCGHAVDEDGRIQDVSSGRVDVLRDILDDHSGKAIIWTCYRHELQKIATALREEYGQDSVAEFHGGNLGTRAEDERRFLGDPSCRFMCSTQAAGGRGNTWNAADLSIYAASSYDLEHRFQSEDRNHRKGQTRPVTYVDLIARGTVEEKIIRCLRDKIDLATAITGENFRQWLI